MMLLFSLARDRYSTQALKNPPKPQTSVFRWSSCALRLHSGWTSGGPSSYFMQRDVSLELRGRQILQRRRFLPRCLPVYSVLRYFLFFAIMCNVLYIYIIITRLYISYCESLPSLFLLNEDDLISLCSRPTDGIMLVFLCVLNGWFYK